MKNRRGRRRKRNELMHGKKKYIKRTRNGGIRREEGRKEEKINIWKVLEVKQVDMHNVD